jgi:D-cysteine desulfhydrase
MKRLHLAHLPTPLEPASRLSEALGVDLWIKRDDASEGAAAGNKIRKLEFLMADALERGSDVVITCGGIQSNHARATALTAARLGLDSVLLLRDAGAGSSAISPLSGNVLLDRMAGAEIQRISVADYARRDALMSGVADELRAHCRVPYVIPEGGSNGLGAMGYVAAMEEIRGQLDASGASPFDIVVHACGSGGTAAGCVLGAAKYRVAPEVWAMAVCDDSASFTRRIEAIVSEAQQLDPALSSAAKLTVDDAFKGEAYAVSSAEQRDVMIQVARASGLILDPVYSGKAFHGLWRHAKSGALRDKRLLFIHTGGLPGLLAQASTFASQLT